MNRRFLKWTLVVLGSLVVLAAAAAGGALWYLESARGQAWVLAALKDQARRSLGVELAVKSMDFKPLSGMELTGLALSTQEGRFFEVARAVVAVNPLDLLAETPRVAGVTLIKPKLTLPLPRLQGEGDGGGKGAVIGRLEVVDGRLDPGWKWGPVAMISDLDLVARPDPDQPRSVGVLKMHRSTFHLEGVPWPVVCRGKFLTEPRGLELKMVGLDIPGGTLNIRGRVDWMGGLTLDLDIAASRFDPRKLDLPWSPTVEMDFSAQIQGPPDKLEVDLDIDLRQESDPGRLNINGVLEPKKMVLDLKAVFSDLDPREWGIELPGLLADPKTGLQPLDGRLKLTSSGTPGGKDWKAKLETSIDEAVLVGVKLAGLGFTARAEGHVVTLEKGRAHRDRTRLRFDGRLNRADRKYHFNLGFSNLFAGPWLAGRLPAPIRGMDLNGRLAARGRLAPTKGEDKAGPVLSGRLSLGPSLLGKGLEVEELEVTGGLKRGPEGPGPEFTTGRVKAGWGGFSCQGRGDLDGGDFQWRTEGVDLAGLAEFMTRLTINPLDGLIEDRPADPAGEVSAKGRIRGRWSDPVIDGRMKGAEVRIFGQSFRQVDLQAEGMRIEPDISGRFRLTSGPAEVEGRKVKALRAEMDLSETDRVELDINGPHSRLTAEAVSADLWAEPLKLKIRRAELTPDQRTPWKLTRPLDMDYARGSIHLTGLGLAVGGRTVDMDGRLTWTHRDAPRTDGAARERPRASLQATGIRYKGAGRGPRIIARDLEIHLDVLEMVEPDPASHAPEVMVDTRLTGRVTAAGLTINRLEATDFTAEVTNDRGLIEVSPFSLHAQGALARGGISLDLRPAVPGWKLNGDVDHIDLGRVFEALDREATMLGQVDLDCEVTTSGSGAAEMTAGLSGLATIAGRDMSLLGMDLDTSLADFEHLMPSMGLLSLPVDLIAEPLGAMVGSVNTVGQTALVREKGQTSITRMLSTWQLDKGVATAGDVCLATRTLRVAVKGGLDLGQRQYRDLVLGVIDRDGCSRMKIVMKGSFSDPETNRLGSALQVISRPLKAVVSTLRKTVTSKACDPFYTGQVAHPAAKD